MFAANYGIVKLYGLIALVPSFLLLQQLDASFLHHYISNCHSFVVSNIAFSASSAVLIHFNDLPNGKTKRVYLGIVILLALVSNIFYKSIGIGQCTINSPAKPGGSNIRILEHAESLIGYVSVVDTPSEYGPIRLMRCDHSILGGTYLDYDNASIYSAFYHLDFVRYVKRKKLYPEIAALQIGLGIGVSAKTLLDSGFNVDVAEIDPKVYEYARSYFSLPEPRNVFLGDGRHFVEKTAQMHSYDYILHDIFTGGFVEPTLFSVEFFTRVKRILKPDGVLAVNYVGHPGSLATKTVVATLKQVFKNVVCFQVPEESEQNITIFATLFNGDIVFDFNMNNISIPNETYLSVRNSFSQQPRLVLDVEGVAPILDNFNPLKALQYPSAVAHWNIMRKVFPNGELWTEYF
ncbi:hypothetical protein HDV01_002011 [Terramyces sp. JEL0728]|nr:hypothetical protein HDV01_002011 [Terramyces sp. JEL0728]